MDNIVTKNVTSVTLTPQSGGAAINLSSVTNLAITDATQLEGIGSDNDKAKTFFYNKGLECRGVIGFTDPTQASACKGILGTLSYTEVGVRGASQTWVVYNCQVGGFASEGQWQNVRGHPVNFMGGFHGSADDGS